MPGKALRQRLSAWIAMIAVLAGVLVPGAIHAMSQLSGGERWVEVCTPSGMKLIAVDAGQESPGDTGQGILVGSCPFCATHAGAWALPSDGKDQLVPLSRQRALPAVPHFAPRQLFAWTRLQARAPPFHS